MARSSSLRKTSDILGRSWTVVSDFPRRLSSSTPDLLHPLAWRPPLLAASRKFHSDRLWICPKAQKRGLGTDSSVPAFAHTGGSRRALRNYGVRAWTLSMEKSSSRPWQTSQDSPRAGLDMMLVCAAVERCV